MRPLFNAARLSPFALLTCHFAAARTADPPSSPAQDSLETIIVSGSANSLNAARSELALVPGGATLIDLAELQSRNVGSLADALRYVPGVWAVSDTGNDGIFFSSRGSNLDATDYDMNGIKLMQDGLPVTTADGNNHNRIIDPLAARYAVMARGANALKYGASTLGGAVNFVTPTAHDEPLGAVSLRTGSHGQALARFSAARVFSEAADAMLTVEAKRWDGYRQHNEQDRAGLYANAGWQLSDDVATRFFVTAIENNQRLPGSLTRAQFDADPNQASAQALGGDYQLNVDTTRLANKTTVQLGQGRAFEFGLSLEQQSLFHPIVDRVLVDFDGPGPGEPVEVFSLLIDTDHRDVGGVLRYSHESDRHDLLLGVNYGVNQVDGTHFRNLGGRPNGMSTSIDKHARSLEVFALDRWEVQEDTTLVLAMQAVSAEREVRNLDLATNALRNPHSRHAHINPRIGAVRELGDRVSLFANASHLFEPPTNFQLEDNRAGGHATLDAMHGKVVEIGARGGKDLLAGGNWAWDVTLYQADIRDEILSVEDPNAPGTSLVTNIDRTRHAGMEAAVSAAFALGAGAGRSIDTLLSMTINDFRFVDDAVYGHRDLPAAPDYVVRGEAIYRAGNGFHIGPTIDLVGHRFADFANGYRIPSYRLIGLRAGWGNDRWQAFAEVHNLGDETYIVSHSVRDRAGAEDAILNAGEPVSGYLGLQVNFE